MHASKFVVPFALFALLGAFLFVGLYRDPSYVPSPLIGKPAPEFNLPSVQDASYPVASKELLGKPWVLNVWGTWCVGCREEHETLLAIARQNAVPLIGLELEGRQRRGAGMAAHARQSLRRRRRGPRGPRRHRLGRVRRAGDVPDRCRTARCCSSTSRR